ncbi:hypothetical protein NQ315_017058 [Exocentrus adspersus]|uniref:SET domain-containing protein n=1 Tax=Exocentrus adspersus TaxID=1586481 RepID=A0AAV8VH10_9CUCU|nr:hypothetical protein NQ315_017058 [Exocentrus adspersus]
MKRKLSEKIANKDNDLAVINLKRWLAQNDFRDTHLGLKNFPRTGRGVTSSRQIPENDILIAVPYKLMISCSTLQESLQEVVSPAHKLKIHDLLALFLVVEKQKEKSLWKSYLDSLPLVLPIASQKNRENFMESMSRVRRSIGERGGCVLDENLFKWGYILVNTRAVYVDPQIVQAECCFFQNILIDRPSMALCPFLDMFNHHFLARTEAKVVERDGKLFYQLQTLNKYKKHQQIFISYGSHDNSKLVMEYGFFIPGNVLDVVKLDFKDVLDVLGVKLDQNRYKFVTCHDFNSDLYVGYNGVSFSLKALLYVSFNDICKDCSTVIFSDCYPLEYLRILPGWTMRLLDFKLTVFESDYTKLRYSGFEKTEDAGVMESFLKYRICLVNDLKNRLETENL